MLAATPACNSCLLCVTCLFVLTLTCAGCGSIEEVILRDVPRTFPEHPFFSTQDGQQKLLRVLTAYAAADPEVGAACLRLAAVGAEWTACAQAVAEL